MKSKQEVLQNFDERIHAFVRNVNKFDEPIVDVSAMADRIDALTRERDEAREEREGAYRERNQVVAWASRLSIAAGYVVRVTKTAIDGWDVAWHNCAYVMTPTGQASWHFHDDDAPLFADLPHGEVVWDGHTTLEKYDRLHRARYALDALPQGDA